MIDTDVVILGKGIAGLTLSTLLQRKKIAHVIIDRKQEKKMFAYGETLPPSAMPLLYNLGLLDIFEKNSYRKTYGYHSCWGADHVTDINFYHHHPYKNGLKIDKKKILDALEKQLNSQVISYDRNLEIIRDKNLIKGLLLDKKTQINGKVFVDATGRNRALLKKLDISSISYDELISFSCHIPKLKHSKLVHEVYVESFENGWGIVSALNKTENVFSIFTTRGSSIHKQLSKYESWKSILSSTKYLKDFLTPDEDIKVIGGNSNSSKAEDISKNNWLALGDAAIAFDPLSSHGITNALYTAMLASDTIQLYISEKNDSSIKNYHETLSVIFNQYLASKNQLYENERRWKAQPFWKHFFDKEIVFSSQF